VTARKSYVYSVLKKNTRLRSEED